MPPYTGDYERGLVHWRIVVETARRSAEQHLSHREYQEARFEQLPQHRQRTLEAVANFLGLEFEPAMLTLGPEPARPTGAESVPNPSLTERLAGSLLRELKYA